MEEIWKDIKGWEGYYQVSNLGRVRSLERVVCDSRGYYRTIPERIMKLTKNDNGYLLVTLCRNNLMRSYHVHRLVGLAFIPNPYGYDEINHIDENKCNNIINNLEWCDRKYNVNYGTGRERQAEKIRGKKQSEENVRKRSKAVIAANKETGQTIIFLSAREAGRQLEIDQASICRCCKGKQKSAGGFYWQYADSEEVCNE